MSAWGEIARLEEDTLVLLFRLGLLSIDLDNAWRQDVLDAVELATEMVAFREHFGRQGILVDGFLDAPGQLDDDGDTTFGAEERIQLLQPSHISSVAPIEAPASIEAPAPTSGDRRECVACLETQDSNIVLPCGCWFCRPCLRRCIRLGMEHEGSWPPRCAHGALGDDAVALSNRPQLLRLFRQVRQEWETGAAQRMYCAGEGCGAFISSGERDGGVGKCRRCGEETCCICRRATHPGTKCTPEAEREAILDMIDEHGFAECPREGCSRIIELMEGCNHMTSVYPGFDRRGEGAVGAGNEKYQPKKMNRYAKMRDSLVGTMAGSILEHSSSLCRQLENVDCAGSGSRHAWVTNTNSKEMSEGHGKVSVDLGIAKGDTVRTNASHARMNTSLGKTKGPIRGMNGDVPKETQGRPEIEGALYEKSSGV